jgi:hypothetical protein
MNKQMHFLSCIESIFVYIGIINKEIMLRQWLICLHAMIQKEQATVSGAA